MFEALNRRPTATTRGLAISFALAVVGALAPSMAMAQSEAPAASAPADDTLDTIVFRNGNIIKGTIVSETATSIKVKATVGGIAFETEYQKSEIVKITRAKGGETPGAAPSSPATPASPASPTSPAAPSSPSAASPSAAQEATADHPRIYFMEWQGKFGADITETPIRQAIKDALKNKCDTIIVHLDADFSTDNPIEKEEKFAEQGRFDTFHRAESILAAIDDEFQSEWTKRPRLIFWVRRAMEGAAFLPLISPEIYFTEDGRMGGIGNLSYMMRGHERVVQKQISLRMARFIGWAAEGGYPEEICKAMAQREFVLSVKVVGGKPVFFRRYPESPDEELLTDEGNEENSDNIQDIARGLGNDVLTLDARKAKLVGVSKGSVNSREELLVALGLDRSGEIVAARSGNIFKDWTRNLENSKRQIDKLWREFREIQVEGNLDERNRARGTQIRKLDQIIALLKQYSEALDGEFLGPRFRVGSSDEAQTQLRSQQEIIRVEMKADRR